MPSVQRFVISYDALNEDGTFSEGDTLTGKVILALSKETSVQSLFVKAKGDADVYWTRKSGDKTYTYSANKRYFKLKQFLIPESSTETVVPKGTQVYNFSFKIPTQSLPSTFNGKHGQILYKLEAKLSRSWRMNRTVEKDINFVSKSFPNLQSLMRRQVASTRKEMGFFSSGHIDMSVTVDKGVYSPGETMAIVAKINNASSTDLTPKFNFIQEVLLHANGSVKAESTTLLKVVDARITSRTQKDVRCAMKIPSGLMSTIQNCDLVTVKYHLMAYLDISFSIDPEVKLPVLIIPADVASGLQPGVAAGRHPAGAVGGQSYSDFPPSAASVGSYPVSPQSHRYGKPYPVSPQSHRYGNASPVSPRSRRYGSPTPPPGSPPVYAGPSGVYPPQPAHMIGGYNNPVPQLPSPYGSPFSPSSSSSVLHPPPSAPTFPPPPSAPEIPPPPSPPPFSISPTAPSYNLLPSAPMMNTDFLSQSDEPPPSYSVLFPDSSNAK